jgi:DNA polymerase-3 subunit delta'
MIQARENPDLIGHAEAEATLLDAATSTRCPHAWLLLGPRGIGKATLAFRFARFLLANEIATDEGPSLFGDAMPSTAPTSLALEPHHPTFRRAISGGHVDLKVLDQDSATGKTTQIPADAVRTLAPFLRQTSGEGGRRVVVIDALDDINPTGANALLKILEEPPDNTVLILVAHSMAQVLPTIRSRCRLLRMGPLAEHGVAAVLSAQATEQDPGDIAKAAVLADGSPGRALALLEDDGLTIHAAVAAFWHERDRAKPEALTALANVAGQDAGRFRHFVDAFSARLVDAARRAGGGPAWDNLWADTMHLCERTEAVYLDRRQVALNRLTAAAKLG